MTHIDLLRSIAQIYDEPRYLEIGVGDGGCFRQVSPWCISAVAVDVPTNPYGCNDDLHGYCNAGGDTWSPESVLAFFDGGSDHFFSWLSQNEPDRRFDLIFIDGNHWEEQVWRDFENSLEVLAPRGTIALHDTWAETRSEAIQGSDEAYLIAETIERDPSLDCFTLPIRPGITFVRPRVARFS